MRHVSRVVLLCALVALSAAGSAAAATSQSPTIKTLSGRADLVSGGDALLEIDGIASTSGLHVTVGGKDQTGAFGLGPDG